MNLTRKQGLLKRIHRLATPSPWSWEDRDTVAEILETLVEEVFKDENEKLREKAVELANQMIVQQMQSREDDGE